MAQVVEPQENFPIYTLSYVWKQYFKLLNSHKTVTYIIIYNVFYWKLVV